MMRGLARMWRVRRLQPVVLGLMLLLLVFQRGRSKKSKRWTYPRPQWPVPAHRMDPTPCRIFLWNIRSAQKFCTCSRLLEAAAATSLWKDNHMQLWLRLPASSTLLQLFPCQQHSLSRCAKCGHEFRDHVRFALHKHKDRPFDKTLEQNALDNGRSSVMPIDFRKPSAIFGMDRDTTSTPGSASAAGKNGSKRKRRTKLLNSKMDHDADLSTNSGEAGRTGGDRRWADTLAVIAEAQRTSLYQLSGVGVTSHTARTKIEEFRNSSPSSSSSSSNAGRYASESSRRSSKKAQNSSRSSGRSGAGPSRGAWGSSFAQDTDMIDVSSSWGEIVETGRAGASRGGTGNWRGRRGGKAAGRGGDEDNGPQFEGKLPSVERTNFARP